MQCSLRNNQKFLCTFCLGVPHGDTLQRCTKEHIGKGFCFCFICCGTGLSTQGFTCEVGSLLLEPHLQSILLWLWRWGSWYLLSPVILLISTTQVAGITSVYHQSLTSTSFWVLTLYHATLLNSFIQTAIFECGIFRIFCEEINLFLTFQFGCLSFLFLD
jgi:hypothetical protein